MKVQYANYNLELVRSGHHERFYLLMSNADNLLWSQFCILITIFEYDIHYCFAICETFSTLWASS